VLVYAISKLCPYKVSFAWFASLYKTVEFDYHMNDDLGRMVLNPEYECSFSWSYGKCSMYSNVQTTNILSAKKERVVDGEFQTACSNACSNLEQWEFWRCK
jgi:molybdopterin-containing oxidoreductase family iron-sulfur binding subunit